MHKVTCRSCKERFDIDTISDADWIMPSKGWYYHTKCYNDFKNNNKSVDEDVWIQRIYDFLARDLKVSYEWHMCEAQRKSFIDQNKCTNKGIYFALKYFYEVQHNDWDKGHNGIGIVPYIYQESCDYWYKIEEQKAGALAAIEKQIQERQNRETKRIRKKKEKKENQKWKLGDI